MSERKDFPPEAPTVVEVVWVCAIVLAVVVIVALIWVN